MNGLAHFRDHFVATLQSPQPVQFMGGQYFGIVETKRSGHGLRSVQRLHGHATAQKFPHGAFALYQKTARQFAVLLLVKGAYVLQRGLGGQGSDIFGTACACAREVRKLGSPPHSLPINRTHIAAAVAGLVLLAGCDPTKRIPQGEHLLNRNRITLTSKSLDPAELDAIVKQKPNKRILGMRFYLSMYNLPNPEQIARKKARKDARTDEKNESRIARGKKPRPYKTTTGEWLRGTVGEAPVILDSTQTRRSNEQLRLYMPGRMVRCDRARYCALPASPLVRRRIWCTLSPAEGRGGICRGSGAGLHLSQHPIHGGR